MFVGGTRSASFLREESAASRFRVWMERIVRAVRVEEARAMRTRRVVGPFTRERTESILTGEGVLTLPLPRKIFGVKRGVGRKAGC